MKPTTNALIAPVSEADIEGLRADTHAMMLWRVQTQTRRAEDAASKAIVRGRKLAAKPAPKGFARQAETMREVLVAEGLRAPARQPESAWRPFWERATRLEGK